MYQRHGGDPQVYNQVVPLPMNSMEDEDTSDLQTSTAEIEATPRTPGRTTGIPF